MSDLYQTWIDAKEAERAAVEARRLAEDELIDVLAMESKEGSETIKVEGYKVKVTQRFNRSIDSEALQELAAEHGLSEHLPDLFRWKPEINSKAWSATEESITRPLLGAITTKPGRPSFSIERMEK